MSNQWLNSFYNNLEIISDSEYMAKYEVANEIQSLEASGDIKARDECQEDIGTVLPRQ